MVWNNAYSQPSASMDSQLWIKSAVDQFDQQFVKSIDAKSGDTEDWLYIDFKKSLYKWTHTVQTCFTEGPTEPLLAVFHLWENGGTESSVN